MNKNPFDPSTFKNLENIMKNFQAPTQNMFGFGKIKKYIYILAGLIFMSGFGIGVLIGLLF
jgi:hypothetical protein